MTNLSLSVRTRGWWTWLGVAGHTCSQGPPGPAHVLCLWTWQPAAWQHLYLLWWETQMRAHTHTHTHPESQTPGTVLRELAEWGKRRAFKKHKPQASVWVHISASSVSSAGFAYCFELWLLQLLPLKFWNILSVASSHTVSGGALLTPRHIF